MRGTVLGWVHMVSSIGAVTASIVAGGLWIWAGPGAAFFYGAAAAAAAVLMLVPWSSGAGGNTKDGEMAA